MLGVTLSHHICRKVKKNQFLLQAPIRGYQWINDVYGRRATPRKSDESVAEIKSPETTDFQLRWLISTFQEHGHKAADINPVQYLPSNPVPELGWTRLGVKPTETISSFGLINKSEGTANEIVDRLRALYSGRLAVEFTHLEELEEKKWFAERWHTLMDETVSPNDQKILLTELIKSQTLDKFLATKFVSLKRYGGEGAESMMSFFLEIFKLASDSEISNIIIAAHHRGRLNFITGLLNMPPEVIFRKLKGKSEFPDDCPGIGDVISHLCPSASLQFGNRKIDVEMTNLPSHLEAVCPVSMGQTRATQQLLNTGDYARQTDTNKVLNLQVHGDAAIMGQGVSQESLIMSNAPHFSVGGAVHLVINNHLGFTTPPHCGRNTRYATDVAKIISAPVIHVNGDFPEEIIKATRIAFEYQQKFKKNVFVDMNCYRKWGHNELDDPTFTNPLLYNVIRNKENVPDAYAKKLIKEGVITDDEVKRIENNHYSYLNNCLQNVDSFAPTSPVKSSWEHFESASNAITTWNTGVNINLLRFVGERSVEAPPNFNVHPHLKKYHVQARLDKLQSGDKLDWSAAEALAIGSLLYEGYNVRISGQDVGRGTFSHRHVMMIDNATEEIYIPLNNLSPEQIGHLEVANSILSEEAVLGFEYGFSTVSPNNLVIWEAQFGDFFNGAQIQIDTYITSGEDKWKTPSGLVMLLPHGYDGAGPEHSSCRMERFLQLSNSFEYKPDGEDVNIHIANPTTPAQYFHLLRRQMHRNYRKPLVVVAPKIILRSPDATSPLTEMGPETFFTPVIGDVSVNPKEVQKIIFVSGKHYYSLVKRRAELKAFTTAIIRMEELSPFPAYYLTEELKKYTKVKEFVWSQEEHQNMGAWTYCKPRFENILGIRLKYVGREPCAAPAVGIGEVHKKEAQYVTDAPFLL